MGRAPCCAKVGLNRGRWSAEEDAILINYIKQRGEAGAGSWRSLPRNAGLLRCGKSCRLRWINYLRSDLRRGNFSTHEQDTIIKLHAQLGNKWSLIANQLELGRTDNEIKNYWNSSLSRRSATCTDTALNSSSPNINSITPVLPKPQTINSVPLSPAAAGVVTNAVTKKRRGRTSRAAMKKNKTNTCAKSNKYHQAIAENTTNSSYNDDRSTNCSLSCTNSCAALTSTQTPGVGIKDQIIQDADDALKLKEGFVWESLLFCQNDSQSCVNQNINMLDAANFHEVAGLSFDDDVGTMADTYHENELAAEAHVKGGCDKEIKTASETTSVLLLASPKQAAEGALLSAEWDWINNVVVHPDIIDTQIWSDELDGNLSWLWEYDQYATVSSQTILHEK